MVNHMLKYKLVIFDLDGTLADTSPGIYNSIRYAQKMMNLPEITLEQMRSHVGPPMEESYNRNFGLTGDDLKKAISYHKEYAVQNGYKELELYEGVITVLDSLKQAGIKIAIATLKAETTAVKIFEYLGIKDKFDFIVGADIANPLTKSQMIDKIVDAAEVTKENTVLIGDSKYDALGADESGVGFIAVTYGYGFSIESNIEYSNVGVAQTPAKILNILESL